MNLTDYCAAAASTAIYPGAGQRTLLGLSYLALGLAGEVSEIAELVARMGLNSEWVHLDDIRAELGDVLWYDAMLTAELGISPDPDAGGEVIDLSNGPMFELDPFSCNEPGSLEAGQRLGADLIRSIPMTPLAALLDLVQAAGQVAEIVKKAIRAQSDVSPEKVAPALAEVRRLVAVLGTVYGGSIEEIRAANIAKLAARFDTGTIKVHA